MESVRRGGAQMFRLWITTYAGRRPTQWNQVPPRATALEVVEDTLYSAEEAALFLQGFNRVMLDYEQPIWAVAVPIAVRYEGDAQAGTSVQGFEFADELSPADDVSSPPPTTEPAY
jgi:hypothetical protein